jgi:hypothetical protein
VVSLPGKWLCTPYGSKMIHDVESVRTKQPSYRLPILHSNGFDLDPGLLESSIPLRCCSWPDKQDNIVLVRFDESIQQNPTNEPCAPGNQDPHVSSPNQAIPVNEVNP